MKQTLNLLLLVLCLCGAQSVHAQISGKIYGDPEDFSELKNRTLAVELMEENEKVVAKLSKKEKTADQLEEYQSFIKKYNIMIKDALTNYWKINSRIEYKTKAEMDVIQKEKDNRYALLLYTELADNEIDFVERSPLVVPALIYTRAERPFRMPDYRIYLPSSYIRKEVKYLPGDFKMVLQCMQNNINYNIDNDKSLDFLDYVKKMVKENCGKLQSLTMLVDETYLYKTVTPDEAYAAYGSNMKLTTAKELDKSFIEGKKGEAVLFSIPYGIGKGSIGPINSSALIFMKVVVSSETGEIIGLHKVSMGTSYVSTLLKGDFKDIKDCD